jgi:hypothetical protein
MEGLEVFPTRSDEHVAHEQGMVGTGANDSDIDPVPLIPASEAVDNVDAISGVEVVDSAFSVDAPDLPRKAKVSGSLVSSWAKSQHVIGGGK